MNSYFDFATHILLGDSLEDKLIDDSFEWTSWQEFKLPEALGRKDRLSFSKTKTKLPNAKSLNEIDKKVIAIHSFANHELLATEMMAAAILIYPHLTEESLRFKKGSYNA